MGLFFSLVMPVTRKNKRKVAKKPAAGETSLFVSTPKSSGIGRSLPPQRDLTRFVRWPKYVRLKRQKRVLLQRLKVPPSVNQFRRTLDKNTATQLFKLLDKHAPETKAEKKNRLLAAAKAKADGAKAEETQKPNTVKYGIKHITALIEQKKATLVLIAHDVDPLEIVIWLPALCRKMQVPYAMSRERPVSVKLLARRPPLLLLSPPSRRTPRLTSPRLLIPSRPTSWIVTTSSDANGVEVAWAKSPTPAFSRSKRLLPKRLFPDRLLKLSLLIIHSA